MQTVFQDQRKDKQAREKTVKDRQHFTAGFTTCPSNGTSTIVPLLPYIKEMGAPRKRYQIKQFRFPAFSKQHFSTATSHTRLLYTRKLVTNSHTSWIQLCLMECSYHAIGQATRTHARNKRSTKLETLHIGRHWQTYIGERGGLGQKTPHDVRQA